MRLSNYYATVIYLMLLLLSFSLFACASPESAGSNPTATNTTEAARPTATGTAEIANRTFANQAEAAGPQYFNYIVRVSDKDTQTPIQGAEASIRVEEEFIDTRKADVRGQAVFSFEIDQAGQRGELLVKAEGYKEESFNIALRLDSPPEEVQLSALVTPTPTDTPTPTPTETPSPSPTPTNTPTPKLPTGTPTPIPTETPTSPPPTPTDTPIPPPTPTPTTPTGNLAIPVVFNYGTKVYLTGFDGIGINGPNEVSIGGAPGAEDARQPMFSDDGASVMVKATIGGVVGLYKLTASGFNPEIVIRRGSAEWPVLSADGETVMFSEATLDYRLHKRIPDPTKPPGMLDDGIIEEISLNGRPILAENLLWSEDNRLVFKGCAVWKKEDGTCGTWITYANNLDPQRIIVGEAAQPMSIRGGILAYMQRDEGKDWNIFIMSLDDGKVTQVTSNGFEDGLPAISPDGNAVAYISNESGTWGLWTVNLDGQNKKHWFDINPSSGVFEIDKWSEERMSWRR